MPQQLDARTDADAGATTDTTETALTADDGPRVIELSADDRTVRAALPPDATDPEATAIAAAVATHVAATAAAETSDPDANACPWTVAGRLQRVTARRPRGRSDLPGACARGDEWRYAGRCR